MKKLALILPLLLILFTPMQTVAGTSELCWVPPVERMDDTPLPSEEIHGFRIYYSMTTAQPYTNMVDVPNGNVCWTIPSTGTDRAAVVTTLDTGGRESGYSVEAIIPGAIADPKPMAKPTTSTDVSGGAGSGSGGSN